MVYLSEDQIKIAWFCGRRAIVKRECSDERAWQNKTTQGNWKAERMGKKLSGNKVYLSGTQP